MCFFCQVGTFIKNTKITDQPIVSPVHSGTGRFLCARLKKTPYYIRSGKGINIDPKIVYRRSL